MNRGIDSLLEQLEQYPDDDKLLAIIALYYIENPEGDKDLEYLEKAYQINPSIENTHNLAFWLDHEYGEPERGLMLQKQVIEKRPQSYYPYASYAQMLVFNDGIKSAKYYQEIILFNQLAIDKLSNIATNNQQRHTHKYLYFYNNIACAHVMLNNYQQAFDSFAKSMQFMERLLISDSISLPILVLEENIYIVLLNQIRLHILLDNKSNALELLTKAKQSSSFCELEVADLYARLGEYQSSYEIIINEHVHESWEWIFYAIYQTNQKNWHERLKKIHEDELSLLLEVRLEVEQLILDNKEVLLDKSIDIKEREAKVSELANTIRSKTCSKPKEDTQYTFRSMYCGCLLFGCWIHGCLTDDSNRWYQ